MKQEKSCKNCRYYLVHYVKTSLGYTVTNCGHCGKDYRLKPKANICESWDKIENAIPEAEKILDNRLAYLDMHMEKIQGIIDLLKDLYGNS